MPSAMLNGRPALWRCPLNTPHRSAMARVTGRILSENSGIKSLSIQSCSRARRLPSGRMVRPLRSSPIVTTLRYKDSSSCELIQWSTRCSGWLRMTSDGMFVSSRKPLIGRYHGPVRDRGLDRDHPPAPLSWSRPRRSGVLTGHHRPPPAHSALPVPGAIDPLSTQGIPPASGSGRRRLQGFRWLRSCQYAPFFKVSLRANVFDATETERIATLPTQRNGVVIPDHV